MWKSEQSFLSEGKTFVSFPFIMGKIMNENLKKGIATRFTSGERAVEAGRNGGIASQKKAKERKQMREAFETILSMGMKAGDLTDISELESFNQIKGTNISVQDAITAVIVNKALKGDIKSAEFVRDSIGQKPDDRMKIDMNVPVLFSGEDDLED